MQYDIYLDHFRSGNSQMLSLILMLFLHHLNSHPSDSATCSFTISTLLTWVTICKWTASLSPQTFPFVILPAFKQPHDTVDGSEIPRPRPTTIWMYRYKPCKSWDFNCRSLKDGEFDPRISEGQAAAASFVFAPGVPQNGWLKNGNPLLKLMIWEENPLFSEIPHLVRRQLKSCSWKKGHFTTSS